MKLPAWEPALFTWCITHSGCTGNVCQLTLLGTLCGFFALNFSTALWKKQGISSILPRKKLRLREAQGRALRSHSWCVVELGVESGLSEPCLSHMGCGSHTRRGSLDSPDRSLIRNHQAWLGHSSRHPGTKRKLRCSWQVKSEGNYSWNIRLWEFQREKSELQSQRTQGPTSGVAGDAIRKATVQRTVVGQSRWHALTARCRPLTLQMWKQRPRQLILEGWKPELRRVCLTTILLQLNFICSWKKKENT